MYKCMLVIFWLETSQKKYFEFLSIPSKLFIVRVFIVIFEILDNRKSVVDRTVKSFLTLNWGAGGGQTPLRFFLDNFKTS